MKIVTLAKVLSAGLSLSAFTALPSVAQAKDSETVWLSGADLPYEIDLEDNATHCEISLYDFAFSRQGYRGTSDYSLLTRLQTRSSDQFLNVGVVVKVYEESVANKGSANEVSLAGERTLGLVDTTLLAQPENFKGKAFLSFSLQWNNYGRDIGTREIKEFSFFVDVQQDGQVKRLWLRNGATPFTPADYDREVWNYSFPESWGYGSIQYLWKDSGSPLFDASANCQ